MIGRTTAAPARMMLLKTGRGSENYVFRRSLTVFKRYLVGQHHFVIVTHLEHLSDVAFKMNHRSEASLFTLVLIKC